MVQLGGHSQCHRVDTAVERGHVRFRCGASLGGHLRCTGWVDIDHRHKPRTLQHREDPCVVSPEMPDTDNREPRPGIIGVPPQTVEGIRHGSTASRR